MSPQKILFSPVTRLSGLLSVELFLDEDYIIEANVSSTMFRGFEFIMRDHHVTDAVYLTQRICGICSLAHGATASYLLDELYDNDIDENAQYLRNIMFAADFLQNHIRHFYFFGLPDFVIMPDQPPFLKQNCTDCRLDSQDNRRVASHYLEAVKAAEKSHQILALFGGKAPHQHSFVHGGVAVAPTTDKINQALALLATSMILSGVICCQILNLFPDAMKIIIILVKLPAVFYRLAYFVLARKMTSHFGNLVISKTAACHNQN
jgi:hydrogenase large subunit